MADINTNPPGGLPPRPAEAPKVQPKKETVRISLPPKPTPSATIKLPTMPSAPVVPPAPPTSAAGLASTPAPTASAARPLGVGAPAAVRPPTRGPASRPIGPAPAAGVRPAPGAPAAAAPKKVVSGLDVGLAIAAAVLGLGAVVYTWFNLYMN